MIPHKPTFAIVLDKRKPNTEGKYPLKLRVTLYKTNRTYSLKTYLSPSEYEKLTSAGLRTTFLKEIKYYCDDVILKSKEIAETLTPFTFESFKQNLFAPKSHKNDQNKVETLFNEYIAKLQKEGRVSTYQSYQTSLNSLLLKKTNLCWSDVTVEFLTNYENSMLAKGVSSTTIGFYLRAFRAICNKAKSKGLIEEKDYPFGRYKYQIPAGKNTKKALTLAQVKQIFDYKIIKHPEKEFARDLWVFSYLCNGMNIKDIARLCYSNIKGERLTFYRAKTHRATKGNSQEIIVILDSVAKKIIARWGNKPVTENFHVFPILPTLYSPEEERKVIQNKVRVINNYMKKIGKEIGIDKHITSYTARHSNASVLKRGGAPIEYISESLGHSNIKTTAAYLDSFEDDTKKKYSKYLTNFEE
jgi:integrase/recombinase XerD